MTSTGTHARTVRDDVKCPQISMKDLSMEKDILGSGGYGAVYRGLYRGLDVAVKVVDQHKYSERNKQMILTCKEARSMCNIEHTSIVKIYGIILDDMCGLVLEFIKYGSLWDVLRLLEKNGSTIPIGIQVQMMADISEAMRYLHSATPRLIHADLKLGNVLVDDRLKAKLCDFGLSILQGYTSDLTNLPRAEGTLSHMAPELFKPDIVGEELPMNSPKTDVWSFGVALFELIRKESLFQGLQKEIVIHQILRGIKDPCMSQLENCEPSILVEVVSACLEYHPTDRTDFEKMASLLHDEFIATYHISYIEDLEFLTELLQEPNQNEGNGQGALPDKRIVEMREMLRCKSCQRLPTKPTTLPCLHILCEKCLGQHMAKKAEILCSTCNVKFATPKDAAPEYGFKRNVYLENISKILANDDNVHCDNCKSDSCDALASSMCAECSNYLCQKCARNHRLYARKHYVADLDDVKNGKYFDHIRAHQKVRCCVHKDKILDIYCEQCEIPICSHCCASSHSQHKLKELNSAAKESTELLRMQLDPWTEVVQHSNMLCEERKQILQKLGQQKEECECEIKKCYSSNQAITQVTSQQLIQFRLNTTVRQLNECAKEARTQAQIACDQAELNKVKFSSVVQYVNNILETAQDAEKLYQLKEIRSRLKRLEVNETEMQLRKPLFRLQLGRPGSDFTINVTLDYEIVPSKQSKKYASLGRKLPALYGARKRAINNRHSQLVWRFSVRRVAGDREGLFGCWGMAISDGQLMVADRDNKNFKVYDKKTFEFQGTIYPQTTSPQYELDPWAVACNKHGHWFVTDRVTQSIHKYDAQGSILNVYPSAYKGEVYVTCHNNELILADRADGRLIFSDFDCKVHHQIDGQSLGLSDFSPRWLCVDEISGHLIVSQQFPGRVYVIDCKRLAIVNTFTDELGYPEGVCVDKFGNILVTDWSNDRIILFRNARAQVLTVPGDLSLPTGICVSAPGKVSVLEFSGRIKVFNYLGF